MNTIHAVLDFSDFADWYGDPQERAFG